MLRPILAFAFLVLALPVRGAESAAARIEANYRAKRQASLSAQWMVTKLPFETPAAFLARLLDTARDGDSRATCALGWEFHNRKDDARARTWLGRSAESENPFAAYLLGLLPPSKEAADAQPDWMRRAADAGLPEAQFEMALRQVQGKAGPVDVDAARQWYARAAEQKYVPALCNLATLEMQGGGGPVDLPSAEKHFRSAADAGFPQGTFGVGEVLRMQKRYEEAATMYARAAEAGLPDADFWLGCFAREGIGQTRDEQKAAKHFLAAAGGGHALSQAIAADVLRSGTGIAADSDTAAHWDAEVQKHKDPELIALIGTLYLEGRLVKRDLTKALQFFRSAATHGQPVAQRWAGALLASGEAGERNLLEAYQWLWLAARNGQADAEPAFQAVLQAMDGNQIMEAAKRASEFQPTAP